MSQRTLASIALITPLTLALLLNFLAPIAVLLARGFQERELPVAWPKTAAAIHRWNGGQLPDAQVVTALSEELRASRSAGTLSDVANRLNYDIPGLRSLILNTAQDLSLHRGGTLESLRVPDPRRGERSTWNAIKRAAGPATGADFGDPGRGYVRLNFATSADILDSILRRMTEACATKEHS